MTEISVAKAWDYAIGLIKVDGLTPENDISDSDRRPPRRDSRGPRGGNDRDRRNRR